MTGSIGTAPMRRLRSIGVGRRNLPQAWQRYGAARCAGALDTCGIGCAIPKNRIVLGN